MSLYAYDSLSLGSLFESIEQEDEQYDACGAELDLHVQHCELLSSLLMQAVLARDWLRAAGSWHTLFREQASLILPFRARLSWPHRTAAR
jgi:hypothetical protein